MRLAARIVALIIALTLLAGVVVYLRPEIMPPGPMHPRSIVYKLTGQPLHPWVRLDPDKKYVVEFWDVRWPVFRREMLNYEDYLEYIVQGFMAQYPNVRVEIKLVDLNTDEEWLRHALNTGTFPDVLSAPFDPWLVERGFLADLSDLLDDTGRATYVKSAIDSVTYLDKIWAYPRWLDLHLLVCNAKLAAAAGLDVESIGSTGWTWEQFISSVGGTRKSGSTPYIPDAGTMDGLQLIAQSCGAPKPFDTRGNFVWTAEDLTPFVSLVKTLQDKGITPSPPGKLQDSLLEAFWSGRVLTAGPFSSGILRHVRERRTGLVSTPAHEKESSKMEIGLLPVPTAVDGRSPLTAGLMSTMVFKNDSAEQMRAAAAFAEFLATERLPRITDALQVVSCYLPHTASTVEALVADKGKDWVLAALQNGGPEIGIFDAPLCPPRASGIRKIEGAVRAFWSKPTTAESLVQSMHKALATVNRPK